MKYGKIYVFPYTLPISTVSICTASLHNKTQYTGMCIGKQLFPNVLGISKRIHFVLSCFTSCFHLFSIWISHKNLSHADNF